MFNAIHVGNRWLKDETRF